jgi:DNA-binding MurR/RpiR family transcriptional regulator
MISATKDTLRDTATAVQDEAGHTAAQAIKDAKRQARTLMDQSGALIDTVATRARDTATDIGDGLLAYTKKHPLTALLLALGAGALLIGAANSVRSRR